LGLTSSQVVSDLAGLPNTVSRLVINRDGGEVNWQSPRRKEASYGPIEAELGEMIWSLLKEDIIEATECLKAWWDYGMIQWWTGLGRPTQPISP